MGNPVPGISIVVPVGPNPAYLEYLPECLESIADQMHHPSDQIILIDDMAHLKKQPAKTRMEYNFHGVREWARYTSNNTSFNVEYIENPWLLGCAASWNIGVVKAANEWCILMGSDDKLMSGCLDACREVISNQPDPFGYYNLTIQLDNGEKHDVFNNAAMVSKSLWRATGGFPISAAVGAPDALLISMMMVHMPHHLLQLRQGVPLYWVRQHEHQDTRKQGGFFWSEVISIRDKETQRFTMPEWTNGVL